MYGELGDSFRPGMANTIIALMGFKSTSEKWECCAKRKQDAW